MPVLKLQCESAVPPRELWHRLLDQESLTTALPDVRSCTVISQGDDERLCEWAVLLRHAPMRWTQLEKIDHEAMSVSFALHEGDLKYLEGRWGVRSHENGSALRLAMEADFGLPRIASVLHPVMVETMTTIVTSMLRNAELSASGVPHGSS